MLFLQELQEIQFRFIVQNQAPYAKSLLSFLSGHPEGIEEQILQDTDND